MSVSTPVLVVFFNRPDTLKQVLEQVCIAQPEKIYFFQDGPRQSVQTDFIKCQECRDLVDSFNWNCDVRKKYLSENIGCGMGPKTAIDWLFENEESGIILEDDCVPSQSFFMFCDEMLKKYNGDQRVFLITGCNFELKSNVNSSYFFGYSSTNWGWATWRSNWLKMDYSCEWTRNDATAKKMKLFLKKEFGKKGCKEYKQFAETNAKLSKGENISYWDVQWQSVRYLNHQLAIIPSKNLITNIGLGPTSTHAQNAKIPKDLNHTVGEVNFCYNARFEMPMPIIDPTDWIPNIEYDEKIDNKLYPSFVTRCVRKLMLLFKGLFK